MDLLLHVRRWIVLRAALAALILLPAIAFTVGSASNAPAADLSVSFIDVGQGDSIFIVSGNSTMLIDTGERAQVEKVINFIERHDFSHIDVLVGTHPHSDHIGGMANIINRFEIGKIFMPAYSIIREHLRPPWMRLSKTT